MFSITTAAIDGRNQFTLQGKAKQAMGIATTTTTTVITIAIIVGFKHHSK